MKVEYVANDGTRFDTEDECRQYERDNVWTGGVWGIWKDYALPNPDQITADEIRPALTKTVSSSILNDWYVVYIANKDVLDAIITKFEDEGTCLSAPVDGLEVGVNIWDMRRERWAEASKRIGELNAEIHKIQKEVEVLRKCQFLTEKTKIDLKKNQF